MKKNKVYITEGTRSFNPLVEMIPATNTQEAFNGAKQIAAILGMKKAAYVGLILYIRFFKNIPEKDKNIAKLKEILGNLGNELVFQKVSDIGCVKDDGQEWYEMNALICTFLTAGR